MGPWDIVVDIAARYGSYDAGFEPWWGKLSDPTQTDPEISFPAVKQPGRDVNHSPLTTVELYLSHL
jgi:hypothetical protein